MIGVIINQTVLLRLSDRLQAERAESGETEESDTEYSQIYTDQSAYPVKWR